MRMLRTIALAALIAAFAGTAAAHAANLEPIGNFDEPIYVTSDPGDAGRLFVVERGGRIVEVKGGSESVFADLTDYVSCCTSERGLLSIALAPDFDKSGRLFVYYTGTEKPGDETEDPGEIHIAELVGGSLRNLLSIPHPGESNHNGGQLQFGPEGDLFIATGDGGGSNDQHHNAQNLESLLGKILRIDPDPGVLPYTVPAGNPFAGAAPPYDTIWSFGLRNPFRFSFDRGGSGIWIGDVGQGAREEIDHGAAPGLGAGANYGWNCREGTVAGPGTDEGCKGSVAADFTGPVFDYPHNGAAAGAAEGCAVIGGYVVRDASLGGLAGRYLYGDLCGGELRSFCPADPYGTDRGEGLTVPNLNSFGEDAAGHIYAVSGNGPVSRLVGSTSGPCPGGESTPLRPSYAGIRAFSRKVKRGNRALITVWVSPCAGRQGEKVKLYRGRRSLGHRRLSRACTARFQPRISRRSGFRARIDADASFEAATSRLLTIKPHRRHRGRRAQQRSRA